MRRYRIAYRLTLFFLASFMALLATLPVPTVLGKGGHGPRGTIKPPRAQTGGPQLPQRVQVDDLMDLPVVQQPAGHPTYVSRGANQATQFSLAAMHDTVGLLAHNTLAGKFFSRLAIGEQVRLLYGDGRVEAFVITEILRFQALEPLNPTSDLRSLATGEVLSAAEVFDRVYTGAHHLTLQTCIARLGITSWGRLFVIAMPAEAPG